jgi:cathepsin L
MRIPKFQTLGAMLALAFVATIAQAQTQRVPAGTHISRTPAGTNIYNPADTSGFWKECRATRADREASDALAPVAVKVQLASLKARAQQEGWTFAVGYNDAMDVPIQGLTGEHINPRFIQAARRQNGFASEVIAQVAPKRNGASSACDVDAKSFDWRDEGKVTPVQKQTPKHGPSCGDCWNFAAIGAYESNYALRFNKMIKASEQYTLDCATRANGEDAGSCGGANGGPFHGGAHAVFNWMQTHSEATEAQVPYEAIDKKCVVEKLAPYRALTWGWVSQSDPIAPVRAIKKAICEHGGIVASIYASPAMIAYKCGVFNEQNDTHGVDHSIVIIGWDNARKAWLIKNSWGTNWGINGFGWIHWNTNSIGTAAAWVEAANDKLSPAAVKLIQALMDAHGIKPAPDRDALHVKQ